MKLSWTSPHGLLKEFTIDKQPVSGVSKCIELFPLPIVYLNIQFLILASPMNTINSTITVTFDYWMVQYK